jgi:hypothetical protein
MSLRLGPLSFTATESRRREDSNGAVADVESALMFCFCRKASSLMIQTLGAPGVHRRRADRFLLSTWSLSRVKWTGLHDHFMKLKRLGVILYCRTSPHLRPCYESAQDLRFN